MSNEYIREGDLILVQLDKEIKEVYVADISPTGKYMRITANSGHFSRWINVINHLETLISEEDDSEYVDVEEEDDLIGDKWQATPSEEGDAEVATTDTLAKFDERNKRK